MTFAEQFAQHYCRVEMTIDPVAVVAMFAPDAVLEVPGRRVEGREALQAFYSEFLAPMAKIELEVERAFGGPEGVAFEWSGKTRYTDGRRTRASGCDVVSLRDGLITRSVVYLGEIVDDAEPG
jgi:ketosteroid isomerase-like protein